MLIMIQLIFYILFLFQEACVAVAVVMHYLFLSSFCWMLCEGVMLYLLFIVVFSSVSQKPWLFLVIGYGKGKQPRTTTCRECPGLVVMTIEEYSQTVSSQTSGVV